jgi:hypothetical protein
MSWRRCRKNLDEAGEMLEFEVVVRPIKAAGGAGRGNGEPDRPATQPAEGGRSYPRTDYGRF